MTKTTFDICVLPGDGIGVDVIDATLPLLARLEHDAPFAFRFATHPAGAQHYKATGDALPDATLAAARGADAILFGAMGWPEIRYPDGTEIAPQLDLRVRARALRRRASGACDSRHSAAARRSARARHRPRRRARIDGRPLRLARQGRGRRTTARRATRW